MGYYFDQETLDGFEGAIGETVPVVEVPRDAVVRYASCLWQAYGGEGARAMTLAGPDDKAHRAAGGWVYGMVSDCRTSISPEIEVENLSGGILSETERIARMPYGAERGQGFLAWVLPRAADEVARQYPEVDVEMVVTAYRSGERVFAGEEVAYAVARCATLAPMDTEPERVGKPLGELAARCTAIIYCRVVARWVVETNPRTGRQVCPACGHSFKIARGANAWPAYTCHDDRNAHTFDLGAWLPFDGQKRVS